jgi:hypothetical protein
MDCLLAHHRYRHNTAKNVKHRPNFHHIGHLDYFMLDEIQLLSQEIYGEPLYPWWSNTIGLEFPKEEFFGLGPVVPEAEWEDVEEDDVNFLSADMRFLAKKMKSKVR